MFEEKVSRIAAQAADEERAWRIIGGRASNSSCFWTSQLADDGNRWGEERGGPMTQPVAIFAAAAAASRASMALKREGECGVLCTLSWNGMELFRC